MALCSQGLIYFLHSILDAEELPDHLNYNVSVFDRMRDRVAQEKAESRKKNPFASATETEAETEIEFEDVPVQNYKPPVLSTITDDDTTDFDEAEYQKIKPKPVEKVNDSNSVSSSSRSKNKKGRGDEYLSDMSELSDIPTLSDLGESEIGKTNKNF